MKKNGYKIIISQEADYTFNKIKNYVQCVWGEETLVSLQQKLEELLKNILYDPLRYPLIDKEIRKAIISKHYSLIFIIKSFDIIIVNFWISRSANNFY